jgi:RNA polymerase primary sigma factor
VQTLSERLDTELTKQGKTQAALAAAVKVSAATVSQWRAGAKTPSVGNVTKIAQFLGVSPAWLQYGTATSAERAVSEQDREAYRTECRWYFRDAPRDRGRELGNAAGFAFKGGLETLARETGQNISDEALDGEPTVTARFTVMEVSGAPLDGFLNAIKFDELRPHLEASSDSGQKVATVIKEGLKTLDAERRLILLRAEDYGANGLLGEEYESGRYMAVVRNILDSFKGESAGGSYGLGSAVMWATSQFGLVLVRSTLSVAQDGKREGRFIARAELPWHRLVDAQGTERAYAGPAWYGEWDDDKQCTRSYWGDDALAHDTFLTRMDERPGTSFLIVGAYDPSAEEALTVEQMHDELARALATNFWPAMVAREGGEPGLMTVLVRSERNGRLLKEDLIDPDSHGPGKANLLHAHREELTAETLEQPGDVVRRRVTLNVPRRDGDGAHEALEHHAVVLVTEAGEDAKDVNTVAFMRGSHMIIKEVAVPGVPIGSRPFHAVVLAGLAAGSEPADRAAERFLRAAEPPAHNTWEVTAEVSRSYRRGYAKALTDFTNEVRKVIREIVSRPTRDLSDGPDSLKELLRITPLTDDPTKRPKVKSASGRPDGEGRWSVDVAVSLPARKEPWRFSPLLRFGTESGAAIPVVWEQLTPTEKCAVDGDVITADAGARIVRFAGTTKADSHPVAARRATALVDIRVYKGSSA